MRPVVSVLLPCFNASPHLEECLASLFGQTYGDVEVVAVDDGSEDGTAALLARAAADPRLRVLRQPHRGIAAALRTAVREARGSLLARMDADDVAHPERLALQVELLAAQPGVDVVGSRVALFPRAGLRDGLLRYECWVNGLVTHEEIMRDLFVESPLPHPSVMLRRAALERVGGYRDTPWPEDYDLWMRLARSGARFGKCPQVLLHWRDRQQRTSRVDPRFSRESFLALKEHYLLVGPLAGRERVAIWGAGPTGKQWSRRLGARGIQIGHFIEVDPRKIGKRIHGAPVVSAVEVERLRGAFVLVAVAAPGGREDVRSRLTAAGFTELRDFLCIA